MSEPTPKTMAMATSVVTTRGARKPDKRVGGAAQAEHRPAQAVAAIDVGAERGKIHRRRVRRAVDRRGGPDGRRREAGGGVAGGLRSQIVKQGHQRNHRKRPAHRLSVRLNRACRNCPMQQDADQNTAAATKKTRRSAFSKTPRRETGRVPRGRVGKGPLGGNRSGFLWQAGCRRQALPAPSPPRACRVRRRQHLQPGVERHALQRMRGDLRHEADEERRAQQPAPGLGGDEQGAEDDAADDDGDRVLASRSGRRSGARPPRPASRRRAADAPPTSARCFRSPARPPARLSIGRGSDVPKLPMLRDRRAATASAADGRSPSARCEGGRATPPAARRPRVRFDDRPCAPPRRRCRHDDRPFGFASPRCAGSGTLG